MPQVENIRNLWANGSTVADIQRITGTDRKTIGKYLGMTDFNSGVEDMAFTPAESKLDPHKPVIDKLLGEEGGYFAKQRFTAGRRHQYL